MKMNPILKRDMAVSARNSRTAVIITVFNGVLALVALAYMAFAVMRMHRTGEVQYSVFMTVFRYMAWIEAGMIFFVMPAQTSGSISGERERRTLDLILTTRMTETDIILGKLLTALLTISVLIVSSAPVVALVFVFGGITLKDMLILFFSLFVSALLTGSIGIFFSTLSPRTSIATAAAYGTEGILLCGSFGFGVLMHGLSSAAEISTLPLLISPLFTFAAALYGMTGETGTGLFTGSQVDIAGLASSDFFPAGTALQIAAALLLLFLSARILKNSRRR